MWARVSTYDFPSEDIDTAVSRFTEALGDLAEPGLKRAELFLDRASAKALTITVWESEEALQASAEAANRLRSGAAEAAGVSIVDVSQYEVLEGEL